MEENKKMAWGGGASRGFGLFDKIGKNIVLAIVFVTPLFFIPFGNLTVESSKHVLVAGGVLLAFLAWLIARLENGSISIPKSPLVGGAALLVIGYGLSTLFSPAMAKSFIGLGFETGTALSLFVWIALMYFSSLYFRSEQKVGRWYTFLLGSSLVIFVVQVIHLAAPDLFFPSLLHSPTDNLIGKWNDFGIFFGLTGILSLLSLELPLEFKIPKWLSYSSLTASVIVLIVTNVPFVWPSLALVALAMLVYRVTSGFSLKYNFSKKAIVGPSLVVLVLGMFFMFISGLKVEENQSAITGMFAGMEQSLISWENSYGVAAIEARPNQDATLSVAGTELASHALLGAGPNRFDAVWRQYRPDVVTQSLFWDTDFAVGYGYILTAAVTVGWVGIIAWFLFLAGILYTGFRGFRRISNNSLRYSTFLSAFVSSLYLWLLAIVYVPENTILTLAFVFAGALVGLEIQWGITSMMDVNFFGKSKSRFVGVFLLLVVVIGTMATGYVFAKKATALNLYRGGLAVANSGGDLATASSLIAKAAQRDPEDLYYRSLADLSVTQLVKSLNQSNLSTDQLRAQVKSFYDAAYQYANLAYKADPTNYENLLALGRVYETVVPLKAPGAYEAALKAYQDAVALNENNPAPYLSLARLEFTKGDDKAAREYAKQGLSKKSNYPELIFLSSEIEAKDGNIKGALDSARSAATLSPGDIGVWFQLGVLFYADKQYKESAAALERAITINADYSNARFFLGLAYDKLNLHDQALAQLERVKELNPNNTDVDKPLANLKAGRHADEDSAPAAVAPTTPDTTTTKKSQ